jgi:hypothetical protein
MTRHCGRRPPLSVWTGVALAHELDVQREDRRSDILAALHGVQYLGPGGLLWPLPAWAANSFDPMAHLPVRSPMARDGQDFER